MDEPFELEPFQVVFFENNRLLLNDKQQLFLNDVQLKIPFILKVFVFPKRIFIITKDPLYRVVVYELFFNLDDKTSYAIVRGQSIISRIIIYLNQSTLIITDASDHSVKMTFHSIPQTTQIREQKHICLVM